MADVYITVYYECLLEFQKYITSALIQVDVNVDRLTEKAGNKGLIPTGHYTRLDSGKLIASREKRIASLVSRCIESVKRGEELFQSFLALLDDVGLQHLVRRIRRRFAQGGDLKPKRAKGPPPSEDSGVSTSAKSTSQTLPPLPQIPTTSPSLQSPTHHVEASRQPDREMSSSATKQRLPDYEIEKEPSLQPFPPHGSMNPLVPLEEIQENSLEALVTTNLPPQLLPSEGSLLEKQQAKIERRILQTQNQKLIKEKQTLEKKLEEKEEEINKLKADHHMIDKQNKEQKRDLHGFRTKIMELERELEKRDKDNENLRKFFSDCEQQVQNHERELARLRKKLSEEISKAERKEIQIKELNCQILQKEVQKLMILNEYKDKERALERERDSLKVQLERLRQEMIEKDYKEEKELRKQKEAEWLILQQEKEAEECKRRAAEQEKEEEDRKRRVAEQEREEEEIRHKVAEKGHRESLAELSELKEKLNLKDT